MERLWELEDAKFKHYLLEHEREMIKLPQALTGSHFANMFLQTVSTQDWRQINTHGSQNISIFVKDSGSKIAGN